LLIFPFFLLHCSLLLYPSYNVILPDAGCLPAQHPNFWENPETIHIVELLVWHRHQPISPNLKPTCILYICTRAHEILWRHQYPNTQPNTTPCEPCRRQACFIFLLSCTIYFVPKSCDHCPWPSSQFNKWQAQNKLLSSSLIVIGSTPWFTPPSHQRTIVAARLVLF
jgi:hypothetical protein